MITPEERQANILDLIKKKGSVNIVNLATLLNVSEMTIRRDLTDLEEQGLLRRVHGGAVSFYGRSYEPPLLARSKKNIRAKQLIGKYAAGLIKDGDSVALDVGSTIMEVAMNLLGRNNLTVITSSIHIANLLADERNIRVIVTGGVVRRGERSLIGEFAHKVYQETFVDKLFLGTAGFDLIAGLTEFDMQDAHVKKEMIRSGKEVYVLADASKFEAVAFSHFAEFSDLDHIITNRKPAQAYLEKMMKYHVTVHIVTDDQVEKLM